ncbi:MAG TPA: hypothetical protein VFS46_02300 [Nitrososphaera sp.]|nr:hypothetical protein [Nitrososphaera sp.]
MSMEITPPLKVALSELYYKEGCDQKGWAYISLENIHSCQDNVLAFSKGDRKIKIRLMDGIMAEVKETSRPADGGFVFEYLACKVGQRGKYDGTMLANPTALCWVKIGKGAFSDGQIDAMSRIKIPLAVFRIRDVLAPPAKIEMKWEIKSGKEWLDELDDLRDQAESDDDYF